MALAQLVFDAITKNNESAVRKLAKTWLQHEIDGRWIDGFPNDDMKSYKIRRKETERVIFKCWQGRKRRWKDGDSNEGEAPGGYVRQLLADCCRISGKLYYRVLTGTTTPKRDRFMSHLNKKRDGKWLTEFLKKDLQVPRPPATAVEERRDSIDIENVRLTPKTSVSSVFEKLRAGKIVVVELPGDDAKAWISTLKPRKVTHREVPDKDRARVFNAKVKNDAIYVISKFQRLLPPPNCSCPKCNRIRNNMLDFLRRKIDLVIVFDAYRVDDEQHRPDVVMHKLLNYNAERKPKKTTTKVEKSQTEVMDIDSDDNEEKVAASPPPTRRSVQPVDHEELRDTRSIGVTFGMGQDAAFARHWDYFDAKADELAGNAERQHPDVSLPVKVCDPNAFINGTRRPDEYDSEEEKKDAEARAAIRRQDEARGNKAALAKWMEEEIALKRKHEAEELAAAEAQKKRDKEEDAAFMKMGIKLTEEWEQEQRRHVNNQLESLKNRRDSYNTDTRKPDVFERKSHAKVLTEYYDRWRPECIDGQDPQSIDFMDDDTIATLRTLLKLVVENYPGWDKNNTCLFVDYALLNLQPITSPHGDTIAEGWKRLRCLVDNATFKDSAFNNATILEYNGDSTKTAERELRLFDPDAGWSLPRNAFYLGKPGQSDAQKRAQRKARDARAEHRQVRKWVQFMTCLCFTCKDKRNECKRQRFVTTYLRPLQKKRAADAAELTALFARHSLKDTKSKDPTKKRKRETTETVPDELTQLFAAKPTETKKPEVIVRAPRERQSTPLCETVKTHLQHKQQKAQMLERHKNEFKVVEREVKNKTFDERRVERIKLRERHQTERDKHAEKHRIGDTAISMHQAARFGPECATKTYTWTEGDSKGHQYIGGFVDGEMHGFGTYTWPTGTVYIGEFRNGRMHGDGIYETRNGRKYVGGWKYGMRHGRGVLEYRLKNRGGLCRYEGGWKNGKKHGHGILMKNGIVEYDGEWKAGRALKSTG